MMCDECGIRQAAFHLAIVEDGEKRERNLCPVCMAKTNTHLMNIDFSGFAGLLSGFIEAVKKAENVESQEVNIVCGHCGTSYEVFRKTGLLGCANCYTEFREPLEKILNRIHGHTQHAGRVPEGKAGELTVKMTVERLKEKLVKAIAAEEYEEAAKLRDEIRALSAQRTWETARPEEKEVAQDEGTHGS